MCIPKLVFAITSQGDGLDHQLTNGTMVPFWKTFLQKLDIISITALPQWRLLANCFKN